MKKKILTLLSFLILSLNLSLNSGLVFADKPKVDPTPFITNYLDELRSHCKFSVDEFENMREALLEKPPRLINPMSKEESLLSLRCRPYWISFEIIIAKAAKTKTEIDYKQILDKVEQLINEIKDKEHLR